MTTTASVTTACNSAVVQSDCACTDTSDTTSDSHPSLEHETVPAPTPSILHNQRPATTTSTIAPTPSPTIQLPGPTATQPTASPIRQKHETLKKKKKKKNVHANIRSDEQRERTNMDLGYDIGQKAFQLDIKYDLGTSTKHHTQMGDVQCSPSPSQATAWQGSWYTTILPLGQRRLYPDILQAVEF